MACELVLRSNHVFTSLGEKTQAGCVGVTGRRIAYVGSDAESCIGPGTRVVHVGDALICPGLHDSHVHDLPSALNRSRFVSYYEGSSPADCVAALSSIEGEVRADDLLFGYGWRHGTWDPPVLPTRADIDAVYPSRPVVLQSGDAHTLWCNTLGLEALGVGPDSEPPEGGIYQRDDGGQLTGIIQESAATALVPRVYASFSHEQKLEATTRFAQDLNANGITSVDDLSLLAVPGGDMVCDDLYAEMEDEGRLSVRVNMFPTALLDLTRARLLRRRFRDDGFLRCGGLKQFFDGVSSTHTAWLFDEYVNPYHPGDCGRPSIEPELLRRIVLTANAEGFAVRVHAIGDKAVHVALDIFEESERVNPPLAYGMNGIEHLEDLLPSDVERLARMRVCANVQPPHATQDPRQVERDIGEPRVQWMWPFATYDRLGVSYSFGTDSPVVDVNTRNVIYDAVTRTEATTGLPAGGWHVGERITAAQALRAYTLGSAHASGRATDVGTLEAGKLADIAVLSRDVTACDPEEILSTEVLRTYVDGRLVFEA